MKIKYDPETNEIYNLRGNPANPTLIRQEMENLLRLSFDRPLMVMNGEVILTDSLNELMETERKLTHEYAAKFVQVDNWLALVSAAVHVSQNTNSPMLIHEAQESIEKIVTEYEAWLLLSDQRVMEELAESHGLDVVGA